MEGGGEFEDWALRKSNIHKTAGRGESSGDCKGRKEMLDEGQEAVSQDQVSEKASPLHLTVLADPVRPRKSTEEADTSFPWKKQLQNLAKLKNNYFGAWKSNKGDQQVDERVLVKIS